MAITTITTTAGDDTRFAAAVGDALGLRNSSGQARSATLAECKTWLIGQGRSLVQAYENRLALAAVAAPAAFDPT